MKHTQEVYSGKTASAHESSKRGTTWGNKFGTTSVTSITELGDSREQKEKDRLETILNEYHRYFRKHCSLKSVRSEIAIIQDQERTDFSRENKNAGADDWEKPLKEMFDRAADNKGCDMPGPR